MDLASALGVADAIRAREVSPLEVLDACLERVDALDDRVNAVIWRNDEGARSAARAAADAVVRTDPAELPPFHGVPIPIKDLTAVAGWPVTYGSVAAAEGLSTESELVVAALQRAGFVLAGRTNAPEFGLITVTENVRYGLTRNPWDLDHTPGGSSGGAAAAVAAGMFPIAHANDGGGSIRIPASCCGLVGLKASRGRVPSLVTHWEGGAVQGVVTRTVADAAAVLDAISGPDPLCWYNAPVAARPFAAEVGRPPERLRVGVVDEAPFGLPIDPECLTALRAAADDLTALGHAVDPATLGLTDEALAAFLNVVNSGLADYAGVDWSRTEPHVQAGRAAAQRVDSLTYVSAVHCLQRFSRQLVSRWGAEFDVLLTPTMTVLPPKAGDVLAAVHGAPDAPPLTVFQMAAFSGWFNMSGQPAISLPLHVSAGGLPVGVQLVGGPWGEDVLLRLAGELERAQPWSERRPPLVAAGPRRLRSMSQGRARRVGEDRLLSLPNVVTSVRLVCVPLFVWLLVQPHHRDWFPAAVLLAGLGSTDWVDGQLARRLDQVTTLGKVLDPTADRVLLATATIGILAVGAVPTAIAVIALTREGLVALAAVGLAIAGARRIDVQFIGKAGAFGLMCAFPLFLAGHSTVGWNHVALVLGWVAAIAGLTLGWLSILVYIPLARAAVTEGRARSG